MEMEPDTCSSTRCQRRRRRPQGMMLESCSSRVRARRRAARGSARTTGAARDIRLAASRGPHADSELNYQRVIVSQCLLVTK